MERCFHPFDMSESVSEWPDRLVDELDELVENDDV